MLEVDHARTHRNIERGVLEGRPAGARQENRRGRPEQSARGGRRAREIKARGGGQGRPRRLCGDAGLYTRFPRGHWRRIRTNNAIERLNREIRRRTRVVGTFPDGNSALMLVAARLKYVAESEWGSRRYLDVTLLEG